MKLDLKKVEQSLTDAQVIKILTDLGADDYADKEDYIVFPTICHNHNAAEASPKLYYYKQNKRFHCYTECGDTFNVYELIRRVLELHNDAIAAVSFRKVVQFLVKSINFENDINENVDNLYESQSDKYARKQYTIDLPHYDPNLIELFTHTYPQQWISEGISERTLDRYNIRYSINQDKIIIPHYDIEGNLIGIRGRTLNEQEAEIIGKYMPVKVEKTIYSHPLSQNLYGLHISKPYIQKSKQAIVFEGEKSVLLYDTYFNENNAVAVCGSNFNKVQLKLLLSCGAEEVIICFDKEYDKLGATADKYFYKLYNICEKYSVYAHMSFIFDREGLLKQKDSPIDEGEDIFLNLLYKRVRVK